MGSNLAKEIVDFIQTEKLKLDKLSFVCHSMGGLIARVAIMNDLLLPYRHTFHKFTTLATPHLSLLVHNNQIISSAISLYQSITTSACLDQLYLRDHLDKRQCLLYKLSLDPTLSFFNHVFLFASKEDRYVHFEGALVTRADFYQ